MKPLNYQIARVMFVLVLLSTLITGCAPKTPNETIVPRLNPGEILDKVQAYWEKGVNDFEKPTNKAWNAYLNQVHLLVNGVPNLNNLTSLCFSNVAAAESAIANAALNSQGVNSENASIVVEALQSGASFTGEQATTACTKYFSDTAQYLITHSTAVVEAQQVVANLGIDYQTYLGQDMQTKLMNDLAKTYADPAQIEQALADRGISSTSIEWLPTSNLMIQMPGDKVMCDYFMSGRYKESLPDSVLRLYVGHEASMSEMYQAKWNSAANSCTFYRGAALLYIVMPRVGAAASNAVINGDWNLVPTAPAIPTVKP
jgi:hypothetical protein